MESFPYADFVVILFAFFGFIPTILEFRQSRSARMFFAGFLTAVIGTIILVYAIFTGNETALTLSHMFGIMIPGLLFMTWAEQNHNEQYAFKRRMEKFSNSGEDD